jgi:NAD(P)-dependent dehydrogenase (short-subunit alcohol dehydrogenase family)
MGERLKDKVAIITGAGSIGPGMGNGKATALVFAREGARLLLVDNNIEAAQETKALIDAEGGECSVFQADVSQAIDCQKMAETCVQRYGRVDILDNNVALGSHGGPEEISEEAWDRVMNVNVKSMFLACKYVLPCMEKQGSGSIVNISSIAAIRAEPAILFAYSVSKAAVIALTREVAIQYAAKGIRCNTVLPGLIKTPRVERYYKKAWADNIDAMWQRRDSMSPTGKQGEPWDIAGAALFLASDESKYVNGTMLVVDGGLVQTIRSWPPEE